MASKVLHTHCPIQLVWNHLLYLWRLSRKFRGKVQQLACTINKPSHIYPLFNKKEAQISAHFVNYPLLLM